MIEKILNTTKNTLKKACVFYLVVGSVLGATDYLGGLTTGHLSSDLYLGKKQPTFLEEKIIKTILPHNEKENSYFIR